MHVIMQAWDTMVVTLAMLMPATVDAKIFQRCDLAMKLEEVGLNGFKGYTIGGCETRHPMPRAAHHTQTQALPHCHMLPPRLGNDPLSHPLTMMSTLTNSSFIIIAFTTIYPHLY